MRPAERRGGVVLLHGHGRFGASMRRLSHAAEAAGYRTLAPSYRYRRSMKEIVEQLQPRIEAFETGLEGPLHFITHSLGGLVARATIAARRSREPGRMVMLGPPSAGSELADLLARLRLDRVVLGEIGAYLRTSRLPDDERRLGSVDFDLGIIAGNRALDPLFPRLLLPMPNDGKVAVAATGVDGMADHIVLPVSHTLMVYNRRVIRQALAFLKAGRFER